MHPRGANKHACKCVDVDVDVDMYVYVRHGCGALSWACKGVRSSHAALNLCVCMSAHM